VSSRESRSYVVFETHTEIHHSYLFAAKYNWRLGELDNARHLVVRLLTEHLKIAYGADHSRYHYSAHMGARIEAAIRDRKRYNDAKGRRTLDSLRKLWHRSRSSPKDWRLRNINKARWWAAVDLEQGARDHDKYEAIEYLAEHVRFLDDIQDTSDLDFFLCGPYADIVNWFWMEEANDGRFPWIHLKSW
jgi:hypothetical protein